MKKLAKKINSWLKKMDLIFTEFAEDPYPGEIAFSVPWDIENIRYEILIVLNRDWIQAKAHVFAASEYPEADQYKIYKACLVANFHLPETTFSADEEKGDIWIETDVPAETDHDHFSLGLYSIPVGIEYFVNEIYPKLKLSTPGTHYI